MWYMHVDFPIVSIMLCQSIVSSAEPKTSKRRLTRLTEKEDTVYIKSFEEEKFHGCGFMRNVDVLA